MNAGMIEISTVEQLADFFGLTPPSHPLVMLYNQSEMTYKVPSGRNIRLGLYVIVLKDEQDCKMQYGWKEYDFSKGVMNFMAPGQIISFPETDTEEAKVDKNGWLLVFHQDLIRRYALGDNIRNYRFFDYETTEALHASDSERKLLDNVFESINTELGRQTDEYSQSIIVSFIQTLLEYSERFYKRQFITRQSSGSNVVVRFETALKDRVCGMEEHPDCLSPSLLASDMNMSNHYLSDYLKNATGMTTLQHIHSALIDKAKTMLAGTELSVQEIAYSLGFEYPQYFSRLFRNKTGKTPLAYRRDIESGRIS